jgi:hypothetical protein
MGGKKHTFAHVKLAANVFQLLIHTAGIPRQAGLRSPATRTVGRPLKWDESGNTPETNPHEGPEGSHSEAPGGAEV